MPTTLPVLQQADAALLRTGDLAIVAAFTAIGLAVTTALVGFFPQAAHAVALALMMD